MKKKSSELNSIIYYFLIYIPFGAVCPLLSQYLSSIGFSGTEVGIVTSCSTFCAVIGNLVLGKFFSNSKKKKLVICFSLLMCSLTILIAHQIKVFYFFAAIYGISYFFQEPSHGLSDVVISQSGKNFPFIRSFGAIGYAIFSLITGLICDEFGLDKCFYVSCCSYALSIIFMAREDEPVDYKENTEKVKLSGLVKNKRFIQLLICSMLFLSLAMANNTYFSYLFIQGGGSISGIGVAFLLMGGSEAIFMALLPKLERKMSLENIIVIAIVTEIVRFAIYIASPSYIVLLVVFFLQGIMDGILLVEFVKYFIKIVDPKYAALSVSVYNAIGVNLGTVFANLLGGIILDRFSVSGVYIYFVIQATIGLILYFVFGLNKEKAVDN